MTNIFTVCADIILAAIRGICDINMGKLLNLMTSLNHRMTFYDHAMNDQITSLFFLSSGAGEGVGGGGGQRPPLRPRGGVHHPHELFARRQRGLRVRFRLSSGVGVGANGEGIDLPQGCQMAKFDLFLSLDCTRVEGRGRKEGTKFCSVS